MFPIARSMKYLFVFLLLFNTMTMIADAQSPKEFAEVWDETHITDKPASILRHKDVKNYLAKLKELGIPVAEIGKSYGGREIFQVEWGKGPIKVLMWSQMHGDEPTATSALIDMFAFLQTNPAKKDWVAKLEDAITIRAIPMLNPDGAELFQRRNLQHIDINRDARQLETPEGRILKNARDSWKPDIGFNLHNQQELTSVGKTLKQATNSFLAVSGREDGSSYPGFERNKRICAVMIKALNEFIEGNIARYDDDYNPRAFGDMISAWGTPVILIETGGLQGRDESFLIKLNFIAFLSAFQSLVDGTADTADPADYTSLPFNNSGRLFNYLFRNASILNFAQSETPFIADIGINRERRRAGETPPVFIQEIGDLKVYGGLEEFDVGGYIVTTQSGHLRIGSRDNILFYRKDRKIDWKTENVTNVFPPDGAFANGIWIKTLEK